MPYVSINITKKLSDAEKNTLQEAVTNAITVIPDKTPEHTTVCITDGCAFYKNCKPQEVGGFVDVRLFKNSPKESKVEYSKKLFGIFEEQLGMPKENLHVNYLEIFDWGAN